MALEGVEHGRGFLDRLRCLGGIMEHPLCRGRPARSAARYFGWNLARRMVEAEFVMPLVAGAEIVLSNEENYATLAYTERLWDYEEMMFLLHFLREEDLFVDVGANVGAYCLLASAVAKARSVAVEPVPRSFAKLKRNLRLNGIEDRVEAHNIGLADQAGELRFTADRGGLNHVVAEGGLALPVRRLDDVLAGRPAALVKIDVEGYEMGVLRGAPRALENPALAALIVELNGHAARYGQDDEAVHRTLTGLAFAPCRYEPESRRLTPLPAYNRDGLNTIYCRDAARLVARLAAAPKIPVEGDRLI